MEKDDDDDDDDDEEEEEEEEKYFLGLGFSPSLTFLESCMLATESSAVW